MPAAFLILLALELAGDLLSAWLGLPVPGPVLGLALLLAVLAARGRRLGAEHAVPPGLNAAAKALHDHLGLLFVPAGAGLVAHLGLLGEQGPALLAAVVLGTAATVGLVGRMASGMRPVRQARGSGTAAAPAAPAAQRRA